jgi:hypothetical protein
VKTSRERGRWGTWLRQERLRRDLSPEQVREMLAKRGYRVGQSTYAEWESGYKKQPAREAQPHLIALWGSEPAPEVEPASDADLAAAIRAQTAAMTELVAELSAAREAQQGRDEGLAVALSDLASTLERLQLEPADRSQ